MRTALAETENVSFSTRVLDQWPSRFGSLRACCAGLHGWLLFSTASASQSLL